MLFHEDRSIIMHKNDFEARIEKFDRVAVDTQEQLKKVLLLLSASKVPSKDEIDSLDKKFETLRIYYEEAVASAEDQLLIEELPQEGSGLKEYAIAVENSFARLVRQQIERAKSCLTRFTRIRAKLSVYSAALKPYQDAAYRFLEELSEENADKIDSAIEAPKVLLDAIDVEDIHSPEGVALLKEVSKHYPSEIQWGLSGKQYYVETYADNRFIDSSGEAAGLGDSEADEDIYEESEICNSADADKREPSDSVKEPCIVHTDTESENKEVPINSVNISIKSDNDDSNISSATISPTNKIKTGTPSASSFKKEIIKLGKITPELRTILPLLTNVGALTKEQAFQFGVCLDCIEETDKSRKALESSLDALIQKGYLACYKVEIEGNEEEVFCLSNYCSNCLRKESICSQMKGYWALSFGKYNLIGDNTISKIQLLDAVKKNCDMLQYLYTLRGTMSEDDYQTVVQSIRYKEGYYSVKVFDQGEAKRCILLSDKAELIDSEESQILLYSETDSIPETVNENTKSVFLLYQGTIVRCDYIGGKLCPPAEDTDKLNDADENEGLFEENSLTSDQEVYVEENADPTDEVIRLDVAEKEEETVSEDIISSGITLDTILEDTEPSEVLKMKGTPSDRVFCALIARLLNRPVSTKDQLTSVIVQAVLFANGAALEKNRPDSQRDAEQLKLATHLLLGESPYSSEHLAAVFDNPENDNKALMLSAYMFAMLNPSVPYDYGLRNQIEMYFSQYEDYFGNYDSFKPLFNTLMSVQNNITTGFSPATIALIGNAAENEKFLNGLKKEANNYLVVQSPKTRMKVLPILYNNCFGQGSDLYECMEIISDDREDADSIAFVETVLADYCNRQDDAFTLNSVKVEESLREEWDKITTKNKFKLEYDAHDQAIRQFTSRLELMLTWNEQMGNLNKRKGAISRLRVLKDDILRICEDIQKDETWKKEMYANVLSWFLVFTKDYLNGEYSKIRTYSELLLTGVIPVTEDGSPNIDATMAEIRYFEPWRNALRHIVAEKRAVEEVVAEINGDNIDSPDEEAGLKDNLHQLKMIGVLIESKDDRYLISESQMKSAAESADDRTTRFKETLELAYTYGQINEIEKETLSGIMTRYKNDFYASMEFATWRRFLEALEFQIKEYAMGRKEGLRSKLDKRLANDSASALLVEADRLLEEDMNLAVTEEYLNRYDAGETELDDVADLMLHDNDYFEEFLKHENFDRLLQECRRNDGRALKTFGLNYLEKNFPRDWTNRLREDSKTMINSWPLRKDSATPEQIKTLFTSLGLNVIQAFKVNDRKAERFQLIVDPTPRSMADYRHPIAAFGTQMKSPMNVVILYGNFTEKQLVDTVTSLDLGGISIVLIDRPFDAARRRHIGQIFHTQTSGQNPFLLIDQILFIFLAMHQVTERLPALLKCTLPYTTYQPFVYDGGSTADEMFCGRTQELATLIDLNGACVVYGGRQLGKTALLERVESRCSKPKNRAFAVYSSIVKIRNEEEVVTTLVSDIEKKTDGKIKLLGCKTLKEMCDQLSKMFREEKIVTMHLLIDEVDDFLAAIADRAYRPLQPLVDLKRETRNNFKFVIAGLHNVCRAKNATRENGIFGQLGTPLCIKPLSPTDAMTLLSRPLNYLGFQIDRYPHLETILTNTNYYPGILQFFGYMLVQTLTGQYSKYYSATKGNPPFTLKDEQLGSVMNSSDLNKSIKDKFRWSLELDPRYFMIARCITMLYHYYEDDRSSGSWLGFKIEEIIEVAKTYDIHCLEAETLGSYKNLLDEMEEMGILSQPQTGLYRLRRSSFVDIIGEDIDVLEREIINNNQEI